jgi:YHS domain-containing protein
MDKPAQWALVGAAWFLALSVALLGFLAFRHFEAKSALTAATAGSLGELALGSSAVDPVTGATVTVGADTPRVVYQDRVFYFSNVSDAAGILPKRRFLMDPENYVHPGLVPNLSTQAAIAEATVVASAPKGLPTPFPTAIPTPLPTVVPTLRVTAHP